VGVVIQYIDIILLVEGKNVNCGIDHNWRYFL
jgi:hypothetical protein